MLEQLLNQLVLEMEYPPLDPPDEKGMFHFPLNPSLRVSMKELNPGILLFSQIGPCPEKKKKIYLSFL